MTLKRAKGIRYIVYYYSRFSIPFAVQPAVFELQTIVRQMHIYFISTLRLSSMRSKVPICVIPIRQVQNSISFTLRSEVFELHAVNSQAHSIAPNDIERTRPGVSHLGYDSTRLALWSAVFVLHTILRQLHPLTPKIS